MRAPLIYVCISVIVFDVRGLRVVDKVECVECKYRRRSISVRRVCFASLDVVASFLLCVFIRVTYKLPLRVVTLVMVIIVIVITTGNECIRYVERLVVSRLMESQ